MKRFIFGIALLLMAGGVFAANNNYYVSVGTNAVVGVSTAPWTAGGLQWPNIIGDVQWRKLILSNSGNVFQEVTFYENCTSTTAASIFTVITLSSSSTADNPVVIDFANKWTGYYEAECSNLGIMKSSTASDVDLTLFYK